MAMCYLTANAPHSAQGRTTQTAAMRHTGRRNCDTILCRHHHPSDPIQYTVTRISPDGGQTGCLGHVNAGLAAGTAAPGCCRTPAARASCRGYFLSNCAVNLTWLYNMQSFN